MPLVLLSVEQRVGEEVKRQTVDERFFKYARCASNPSAQIRLPVTKVYQVGRLSGGSCYPLFQDNTSEFRSAFFNDQSRLQCR